MVEKRKGIEFKTAIPTEAGYAVAMCQYKGYILLACQFCVYQLSEKDDVFRKIKFEEVKDAGSKDQ